MKYAMLRVIFAAATVCLLGACTAPKKVPYVKDAETIPAEILSKVPTAADPKINIGDLLNIEVFGTNMTAVAPFNKGRYIDIDGKISSIGSNNNLTHNNGGFESSTQYYLVDNQGNISFPILGEIHVQGLTKNELQTKIADMIYPKYVTERPNVDVRLMNFRVTVGGAVRSPGVVQSTSGNLTFLEALARVGDLDIRGDRENILLYRINADGTRSIHRVNIHDKNFLLSPYYYLQQNDYIYVVPNRSLSQNAWQLSSAVTTTFTLVGGASSIVALVVSIINLSKK